MYAENTISPQPEARQGDFALLSHFRLHAETPTSRQRDTGNSCPVLSPGWKSRRGRLQRRSWPRRKSPPRAARHASQGNRDVSVSSEKRPGTRNLRQSRKRVARMWLHFPVFDLSPKGRVPVCWRFDRHVCVLGLVYIPNESQSCRLWERFCKQQVTGRGVV